MRDIYLYEGTDVLKNLLNIRDRKILDEAEADYLLIIQIYLIFRWMRKRHCQKCAAEIGLGWIHMSQPYSSLILWQNYGECIRSEKAILELRLLFAVNMLMKSDLIQTGNYLRIMHSMSGLLW